MLEPHTGDLSGFVLLRGGKDAINALRVDKSFLDVIVAVQLVHQKVGVVGAYAGAELWAILEIWDRQEARLLQGHGS